MFKSRTPNALLRQNPQPWTNAWFDHVQRNTGNVRRTTQPADLASVASLVAWPESEDQTGDKTSLKIAARAATFSEFGPLFTETSRPSGAVSDDEEGGGDVNASCTETASGDDLAQCGGFVIFPHFLHRSLCI